MDNWKRKPAWIVIFWRVFHNSFCSCKIPCKVRAQTNIAANTFISTNFDAGSSNLASERPETAGNLIFCVFFVKLRKKCKIRAPQKGNSSLRLVTSKLADSWTVLHHFSRRFRIWPQNRFFEKTYFFHGRTPLRAY